ncbi:hypothetical protein [Paraburkholderia mimosarum]|uniref:hypothetical protein n=1 Tax=Paraburkholderia mimosarum TaxID=312026 RepID=UPI0006877FF4|nr:hypothetical protein [Paraburkholderia mimosarum]
MDRDFAGRLRRAVQKAQSVNAGFGAKEVKQEFEAPALGIAHARFVGYFELGEHEREKMRKKKVLREEVALVFELSGPNHPPRKLADGTLVPQRITVRETLSYRPGSGFAKLFYMMSEAHGGKATHMAQLLGEAFIVEVFHRKSKDGMQTLANLKGPNGYNVKGTSVEDRIGNMITIPVDLAMTEPRFFIWDAADREMWDAIYIDGEYEARKDDKGNVISPAKSKNVLQEQITRAKNWPGLAERLGL